jgi:hypothetical protein
MHEDALHAINKPVRSAAMGKHTSRRAPWEDPSRTSRRQLRGPGLEYLDAAAVRCS